MSRSVTPPSGRHLRPGRDGHVPSLLRVCRAEPRARPAGGGDTFQGTVVPRHPHEVLPPGGDIRLLSGQTDDTDSPSRPRWGVEKGEEMETAELFHCQKAWQVLGTQEVIYGSMGMVCKRRALPAGTGAKAHPGQMAAPETRWATGHQPSRPRATTGEPGGRQSEVRSPAGRVWARLVDEWHRCGGSRTGCAKAAPVTCSTRQWLEHPGSAVHSRGAQQAGSGFESQLDH